MPARHPIILNGFGRLGLGEAAAKMIDASVDTIVREQDETPVEDMRKALEELAEREITNDRRREAESQSQAIA